MDETRGKYHEDQTGQQLEDDPVQPHVDTEEKIGARKPGDL